MKETSDAVVVGMGPGGEVAASRLLDAGKKVAVVERELIGGERAYWACIPSKTVLRPPEAQTATERAAGVGGAELAWVEARDYRDSGAYRGRGIRSSPVEFTGTRRVSDPEGTRPVNAGVPVQKIGHGSSDV